MSKKNPDKKVGSLYNNGYTVVCIDGERITEHVLVFFLFHGYWPDYRLRHYDGNRSNNSIKNLIEEGETCIRMSKYFGVRYDPAQDLWITKVVGLNFHTYTLGPFQTEQDAAKAHDIEQRRMFGPDALFVNFPKRKRK